VTGSWVVCGVGAGAGDVALLVLLPVLLPLVVLPPLVLLVLLVVVAVGFLVVGFEVGLWVLVGDGLAVCDLVGVGLWVGVLVTGAQVADAMLMVDASVPLAPLMWICMPITVVEPLLFLMCTS
jgi:hypothetical protein